MLTDIMEFARTIIPVAIQTHSDRGQEIILDRENHIFRVELGGAAQLSQVQTRPLEPKSGRLFTPEQVARNIVEADDHRAGTGVLTIENTHTIAVEGW